MLKSQKVIEYLFNFESMTLPIKDTHTTVYLCKKMPENPMISQSIFLSSYWCEMKTKKSMMSECRIVQP